jgi:hypothetical protein
VGERGLRGDDGGNSSVWQDDYKITFRGGDGSEVEWFKPYNPGNITVCWCKPGGKWGENKTYKENGPALMLIVKHLNAIAARNAWVANEYDNCHSVPFYGEEGI